MLEQLILSDEPTQSNLALLKSKYPEDINSDLLECQLLLFRQMTEENSATSIEDIVVALQSFSSVARSSISEVMKVLNLLLLSPATNAVSERSFSLMRRLKTY